MPTKKPDYSTPDGIRSWRLAAGFTSDSQAAAALEIPLRTYSRWKKLGLPNENTAGKAIQAFILDKMQEILSKK